MSFFCVLSLITSIFYRERGITLDLGFSSFDVSIPEHLENCGYKKLQYTLVDCPGHASLIRTIIGGIDEFVKFLNAFLQKFRSLFELYRIL